MRYCTDVIPEDGFILSRHVEGEYCLGWFLIWFEEILDFYG
jgi:hypothetical protein